MNTILICEYVSVSRASPRGKDVEIKARPSFFSKLFQTPPVFLQAFPKKALAVLCDFWGLKGSQTKTVLSKFFLPHRPTFDRVLGGIAPHSTGSRSVGASAMESAGEFKGVAAVPDWAKFELSIDFD